MGPMKKKKVRVYADYAAGMPLSRAARTEFLRVSKYVGNGSSIHEEGRCAKRELEEARRSVARFFNAKASEVVFTASGTEANVIALGGAIEKAAKTRGGYGLVSVVLSSIEHPSIRETILSYEAKGVVVRWIKPRGDGLLDPVSFKDAVNNTTTLVVLHHVNSEIGTIQPISDIVRAVKSVGTPIVHVDACQSAFWIPVHLDTLRADTISVDSLKIGGPRGVGALLVSSGTSLQPIIQGGGQESGLRAGTENVAGIAGFAKALLSVQEKRGKEGKRISLLRDELAKMLKEAVPGLVVNGSLKYRVPNNINVSVTNVAADILVIKLDVLGVAASTGTACAALEEVSPVVSAIAPHELWRAASAVRFTLGPETKKVDIQKIKEAYVKAVEYARTSPKK